MTTDNFNVDTVCFERPIKVNEEWVSHSYVKIDDHTRRGVFLNVGPVILRKTDSVDGSGIMIELSEKDRFKQSWPKLAENASRHMVENQALFFAPGKPATQPRVLRAIEDPFIHNGSILARRATKMSCKDNRGSIVDSLFPNNIQEENGWALLQFEGFAFINRVIQPRFILHGMLLIREDQPTEVDVITLTEVGNRQHAPNLDLETQAMPASFQNMKVFQSPVQYEPSVNEIQSPEEEEEDDIEEQEYDDSKYRKRVTMVEEHI